MFHEILYRRHGNPGTSGRRVKPLPHMDEMVEGTSRIKKCRLNARGVRKVKTGCHTCKIRRKKCDEIKPACTQCVSTQRKCDFEALFAPKRLSYFPESRPRCDAIHFDYFLEVCTPEFSLYFDLPIWQDIIVQVAISEPCIQHAALAIGALSRSHYQPNENSCQFSASKLSEFGLREYNAAIRELDRFLRYGNRNSEIVVLASIVFIAIEVLQGFESKALMHLRNAIAILRLHEDLKTSPDLNGSLNWGYSSVEIADTRISRPNTEMFYLKNALVQIAQQFSMLSPPQDQQ
ncbi:hypothetical protein BGZ60DRAFT_530882 [Tricladium varicosporioides]|nr:hypothetical protein BGZ60DRAFT_530882 [Hymenoscyphus varicosporioides]